MNVKSLVFYNKAAWDAAGYQAPETPSTSSTALTEQIKADGGTPWCMGIESDTATGWPATDWFEDLIMRYGGADGYNSWVKHETLVRLRPGAAGRRRVREAHVHRRATCSGGARRSPAPASAQPATRCSTARPGLLDVQAGQRSSPTSSPTAPARPRRERRRVRLPAGRGRWRQPGPGWRRPRRPDERLRCAKTAMEYLVRDRHRRTRRAPNSSFISPAHGLRPEPVPDAI